MMNRRANRLLTKRMLIVPMLMLAVAVTGCATTKDHEALRADVNAANERASAAQNTANEALTEARAARAAAERAEQAAMEAKAAVEAVDEKIDRMFQKTMNK